MPISISSSPISKFGRRVCGSEQGASATPMVKVRVVRLARHPLHLVERQHQVAGGAGRLEDEEVARHPAPAARAGRAAPRRRRRWSSPCGPRCPPSPPSRRPCRSSSRRRHSCRTCRARPRRRSPPGCRRGSDRAAARRRRCRPPPRRPGRGRRSRRKLGSCPDPPPITRPDLARPRPVPRHDRPRTAGDRDRDAPDAPRAMPSSISSTASSPSLRIFLVRTASPVPLQPRILADRPRIATRPSPLARRSHTRDDLETRSALFHAGRRRPGEGIDAGLDRRCRPARRRSAAGGAVRLPRHEGLSGWAP